MSAVNISGTFKKDSRPDNGLEVIAADLVKDSLTQRLVVGIVVPHAYKGKAGEELIPTVRFAAIEVVAGDDAVTVRNLIDKVRQARHQRPVEDPLPFDDSNADTEDEDEEDEDEDEDEPAGGGSSPYGSDGFAEPGE